MLAQVVANALISSSAYVLTGVGFSLVYTVARFFHFAQGVVFTSAAYFVFVLTAITHVPFVPSVILGIGLSAVLGGSMECTVYRTLRRKRSSPLVLLLASLGIYIVVQNVISLAFGDQLRSLRGAEVPHVLRLFGASVTFFQAAIVGCSVLSILLIMLLLRRTRMGKAMRAVACAPELARISGVDADGVVLWTFLIGSAVVAVGGILVAADVGLSPTMGMRTLMMGIVAAIVGGLDSIGGIVLGALALGMAQHFGVWFIGSQWQDAIAFFILVVVLLTRPQGMLVRRTSRRARSSAGLR